MQRNKKTNKTPTNLLRVAEAPHKVFMQGERVVSICEVLLCT